MVKVMQCHEVKKSANIFIIDVLLYFQMHSAVKLYFSSVSRLEYTGVIFLGMANRQNPILPTRIVYLSIFTQTDTFMRPCK